MTPPLTQLDNAFALSKLGFHVFPIKAGAKFPPLVKNWPERATANSAEVSSLFAVRGANIGIHCKGLVVLDVDVRNGGDASLAALDAIYDLPTTLTTLTPTGGRHLFYRLPEGHPGVPNSASKLGSGIDIKSTGGYVVAPGSEVPAGRYRFEADVPIAAAPEWLVLKLGTTVPKSGTSIDGGQIEIVDAPVDVVLRAVDWIRQQPAAVEGEGGDQRTFAVAAGLRDFGLSKAQTLDVIAAEYNPRCAPPWEFDMLREKVDHAYRYAQNEPGSRAASAGEFPVIEAPPRERKRLLRLDELATQLVGPYLVKGVLQQGSHAVVYGPPGEGKTFVALDISYHVAAGREWHGHRVRQGSALYLAYEGIGGLSTRAAALVQHYKEKDVPLYISGADYNLSDQAGRHALRDDMAQLPEKPALIVIDTLARALHGDENSAQDMGNLNKAVGALIAATGAGVLLIHHSGKNKNAGARGSSALLGAVDTEIQVDRRIIRCTKQRDIEPCNPLGFKLTPIEVGMDADGDIVTSCVVEPAVLITDRLAGLKGNAQLVWDALCREFEDNAPVHADLWRAACAEFLPRSEASARRSFWRSVQALEKRGLVEQTDDRRWQRRLE